jgi:pimeloyl-ACP methyl ester carboxylesterase
VQDVIPVVFQNKQKLKLFGILHKPKANNSKDAAILLLSPGVKMRVAPHRMYNKLAKEMTSLGYTVLRFDFYGLGDSEGEINEPILADVYNSIQSGRFVDDTIAAMDWMEKEHSFSKFIFAGLCGGAVTGLLAAKDDKRVIGLFGLNIPAAFEPSESDKHRYMTKGELNKLRGGYWRNMLKPKSWLRLLTFQSDYSIIFKSLKQLLREKLFSGSGQAKPPAKAQNSDVGVKGNVNPFFAPAFTNLLERMGKILLVFSAADRWLWEFEEKFESNNADALSNRGLVYEKHIIDKANHVLTQVEWQNQMLDIVRRWLKSF